jgi:hypothetical protein
MGTPGSRHERVHAVWDFYDGIRSGIADFRGRPHYFFALWEEGDREPDERFSLQPIDDDTLALVCEQWALFRAWDIAHHTGLADVTSHPGNRGRNPRYDALEDQINARIAALPASSIEAAAGFHFDPTEAALPPGVMRMCWVEWMDVSE